MIEIIGAYQTPHLKINGRKNFIWKGQFQPKESKAPTI